MKRFFLYTDNLSCLLPWILELNLIGWLHFGIVYYCCYLPLLPLLLSLNFLMSLITLWSIFFEVFISNKGFSYVQQLIPFILYSIMTSMHWDNWLLVLFWLIGSINISWTLLKVSLCDSLNGLIHYCRCHHGDCNPEYVPHYALSVHEIVCWALKIHML